MESLKELILLNNTIRDNRLELEKLNNKDEQTVSIENIAANFFKISFTSVIITAFIFHIIPFLLIDLTLINFYIIPFLGILYFFASLFPLSSFTKSNIVHTKKLYIKSDQGKAKRYLINKTFNYFLSFVIVTAFIACLILFTSGNNKETLSLFLNNLSVFLPILTNISFLFISIYHIFTSKSTTKLSEQISYKNKNFESLEMSYKESISEIHRFLNEYCIDSNSLDYLSIFCSENKLDFVFNEVHKKKSVFARSNGFNNFEEMKVFEIKQKQENINCIINE